LGEHQVRLLPLRGSDEQMVDGTDSMQACALLDRLLAPGPGSCAGPGAAACLTVAERDRLLASVYQENFGDTILATTKCKACAQPFDLDFTLTALIDSVQPRVLQREVCLEQGVRLRVPTGEDEQAVASLPSEAATKALLQRCLLEARQAPDIDIEAVARKFDAVAPMLDLEVAAPCPECGRVNDIHFSIQEILLGALVRERTRLLGEVHRLARAYGWSLAEILNLRRRDRRLLVELIEREAHAWAA
jgi:hypothetical protein